MFAARSFDTLAQMDHCLKVLNHERDRVRAPQHSEDGEDP